MKIMKKNNKMINKKNQNKKILLVEQGKREEDRNCPIETIGKCVKCKPFCNITSGFSGAGAFSDGKLSLYNIEDDDFYVGGELHKYVGVEETKKLIDYTDQIYLDFGADPKLEGTKYKNYVTVSYEDGKIGTDVELKEGNKKASVISGSSIN